MKLIAFLASGLAAATVALADPSNSAASSATPATHTASSSPSTASATASRRPWLLEGQVSPV